jgi:hypothetical protein
MFAVKESEQLQRQSREFPATSREFVMTSTISSAVTFFFIIIVGVWAADLVCYHPQTSLDPRSPVSLTSGWR